MAEALLTGEPQTPTDGTTAAQASPTGMVDVGAKQPSAAPSAQPKQAEPAAPTPPVTYELKLSDGLKVSDGMLKHAQDAFKGSGLSSDAANKVFDALVRGHTAEEQHRADTWAEAIRSDTELGGDKIDATLAEAKKALTEFVPDRFKTHLAELLRGPAGNNPGLIALLAEVRKRVGGDQIVTGAPPKGSEDDLAARLYPSMAKKG